ncbi:MAG: PAS domain S-box protein [Flavobacterium sp.]|nr:MAG: PAS domain S-box protein [Flavobacterium sp.]
MRSGTPQIIEDTGLLDNAHSVKYATLQIKSCVNTPILLNDQWLLTVTVADITQRKWRKDETDLMLELATRIGTRVERARTEQALNRSETQYRLFANAVSDIFYKMNADWTEMISLSGKTFLHDTDKPTASWLETYIPESDRTNVGHAIVKAIKTKGTFELEHRVIRADGSIGWTFSRAIPLLDKSGKIVEWFGTATDITAKTESSLALASSELKYRKLFETIGEGFCIFELIRDKNANVIDWVYREYNASFERMTGLKNARGKTVREMMPEVEDYWFETYAKIAENGKPVRLENYVPDVSRWYAMHASRIGSQGSDLIAVLFDDITERKHHERKQSYMLSLSDALRSMANPKAIKAAAADLLGEHLKVNRCHYGEVNGDYVEIEHCYAENVTPLMGKFKIENFGKRLTESYRKGKVQIVSDINKDFTISDDERRRLSEAKIAAYIAVPLVKDGQWLSSFAVHSTEPRRWQKTEIELVQETAERTWAAVERAKAEEAFRLANEKHIEILESISDAFYAVDQDWHFTYVNKKAEQMWNKSREELIGKNIWEVFDQAVGTPRHNEILRAFEQRKAVEFETYTPVTNGWVQISAYPAANGGITVYFRDISQSKKNGKKFIETVTDTIPDLITIMDVETNTIVYTNQHADKFWSRFGYQSTDAALKMTDYERAEITVHPDDKEKVAKYLEDRKKIKGDEVLEVEVRMFNGNYSRSRSKVFKRDKNGQPTQILSITSDITEQRKLYEKKTQAQAKIAEQSQLIHGIANASADILYVMDIDKKNIIYTNHVLAQTLGYNAKQIAKMSNPVLDIMHPDDLPRMIQHIDNIKDASDDEVREIEYRLKHADGSVVWFRDRNTVFKRDEYGIPVEKLGICQNINERKLAEENIRLLYRTLRDKNRELQSLNNEMKTFTSIAASDYKETLATLYTNLEFIISRDAKHLSNTGKANLRKAQTAIQKMKLLTDDIVAFSRLHELGTSPSALDLNMVLSRVAEEFKDKLESLDGEIESDELPVIDGFPILIDLMFFHLLSNSVKFHRNHEKLRIRVAYRRAKNPHLGTDMHQILFIDNGIGIASDEIKNVFEMFYRNPDRKYRGSGIGLTICKKIADLHGGTMTIESVPGRGTTVCCFFPIS